MRNIASLVIVLAINCAPYLSEDQTSCPCKGGWKCCQGRCIPEAENCTTDGGTDVECNCIDGWKCCVGTCIPVEAVCPSNGSTKACMCRNPQDTIDSNSSEVVCFRKDYYCSALDPCESGYECDNQNNCVCIDPEICGIGCSSNCTCPSETVCDPRTDACREPWLCLDNIMCSGGDICRLGFDGFDYFRCQSPTGNAAGDPCRGREECDSSICYTGVCLQFCSRNADCPSGMLCMEVDHGEMGCVFETYCPMPCDEPDQYCADQGHECRSDFCRTSADCSGICAIELDRPLAGKCLPTYEPGVPACGAQEFVAMPAFHEGYCIVFQACWSDADCQSPYTCVSTDLLGAPMIVDTGLCARQVL